MAKKNLFPVKQYARYIAIEFADFISGEGWVQYDGVDRWICPSNNTDVISTSKLFDLFLTKLLKTENNADNQTF